MSLEYDHHSIADVTFKAIGRVYVDDMDGESANVYAQLFIQNYTNGTQTPVTQRVLLAELDDETNGYQFDVTVPADVVIASDKLLMSGTYKAGFLLYFLSK
jgi:hypothetical protein